MLDLREVNALIRDKMQTDEIAELYKTIANNPHLDIGDALKLGAEYGIEVQCDTFDGWNMRGYRVLRGERSSLTIQSRKNGQTHSEKYFRIDQTTAAHRLRNNRIAESVFEGINRYVFMKTVAEKVDFNAIVAAVRNYAEENNIVFNAEYEPVIATGIASILAYTCKDSSNLNIKPIPFPANEFKQNAQILREIHSQAAELLDLISVAEERKKAQTSSATANKDKTSNQEQDSLIQTSLFDTSTVSEQPEEQTKQANPPIEEQSPEISLSPFYKSYLEFQSKYPDAIIAYRIGDFYEVLGENAVAAADKLNLTLTGREVGLAERIPMCGFPFHVSERYFSWLIEDGHKVAVIEPLDETASESDKFAERILTPVSDKETADAGETPPVDTASIAPGPVITEPVANEQDIIESPAQSLAEQEEDDIAAEEQRLTFGGAKTRFKDNLAAIKLLRELQSTGRVATAQEKATLRKYVGWGGIPEVFDLRKDNWQRERIELQSYLNDTEYQSAAATTTDAFYTPFAVVKSIYAALERFGVKGGNRILEPSMGVGNFFRVMPKEIKENSELYGVEIDSITGEIAKQIYPEANITINGFEKVLYPNGYFDVVVGNVPFGNSKPVDIEKDYNFKLHNFVIAKSIDKVRAGGIVALITTSSTMDESYSDAREYIADRAELLGAIRLPYDTFQANANTLVGTDILFLRKRDTIIENSERWAGITTELYDDNFHYLKDINTYFRDNPEMVIGEYSLVSTRFNKAYHPVLKDGESLEEKLAEVIQHLPTNVFTPVQRKSPEKTAITLPADESVKNLNLKIIDGKVYQRKGDVMVEMELNARSANAIDRIAAMIELRDSATEILAIQRNNCSDTELEAAQGVLSTKYDSFVKRFGTLHSRTNKKLFEEDGEAALLLGLEDVDPKTREVSKAEIFTKRTIRPVVELTHTDSALEALQICKNERGVVDIKFIENLTGKDFDTIITELDGVIFKNPQLASPYDPYRGYEAAEVYLSGDVREKLEKARYAATGDQFYSRNVTALEAVQPLPIPAEDIIINLGATWIDEEYYEKFIKEHILQMSDNPYGYEKLEVHYSEISQSFVVDSRLYKTASSERNTSTYGTEYITAVELFTQALNLKTPNIYDSSIDSEGKTTRVFNAKKTALARQKQQQIKEEFSRWIFEDFDRREYLANKYNNIFNRYRLPEYDGSHLTFPGMNPEIVLEPHQKNAVYRGMADGTVLLHHSVGAGKTFEMDALIMKLRQSGLAHKPLQVVPKSLLEQSEQEFRKLYPSAKLLVAHPEDFRTERRKEFVAKVALGDWDCIIMAMSQFEEIKVSPERQAKKLSEEIIKIADSVSKVRGDKTSDGLSVKKMNGILKKKRAELERLMKNNDKADDFIRFEDLGVDYLFIDEAHNYKNKYFYTKMSNVAGISSAASQKASMLDLKIDYINELHHGDKGVIFATGTPISNSMSEMYTMQSYLQKSHLKKLGLDAFDNWAATFGEIVNSLEIKVTGDGYKTRKRFASFVNVPELMTMYGLFADVKTKKDLNLPTPTPHYEKMIVPESDLVKRLMQDISKRAEAINGGGVDPAEDNMLKITSDGKKIALDPRLFDNAIPEQPGDKLQVCAEKVAEIYHNTAAESKTQIIFCDTSTPKPGMSLETYDPLKEFNVYYEMERKLINLGLKKEEIAFIHDYENEEAKKRLFDEVNSGKIRVLFGSTTKCGVGMNVQRKLIACHHLDIPYRPADMEQREGRIIRQGNENSDVTIYTYAQEGTFDVYLFQILETKQKFIQQLLDFKLQDRKIEDIADSSTLSYSEMKAAISGDTRIIELEQLRQKEASLRLLENEYKKNIYRLQTKVNVTYPREIEANELLIKQYDEDIATSKAHPADNFSIMIDGKTYTDRGQDTADAFAEAYNRATGDGDSFANYRGFNLSKVSQLTMLDSLKLRIEGANNYIITLGESKTGNLTRIENAVNGLDAHRADVIATKEQAQKDLEEAKKQLDIPFAAAQELEDVISRLTQLKLELGISDSKTDDVVVNTDETASGSDNDSDKLYRRIPLEYMEHEDLLKGIAWRFNADEISAAINSRQTDTQSIVSGGIDYENINSYSTEDLRAALENLHRYITADGYEVIELKQQLNRTNAIIHREIRNADGIATGEEYVIGLNYDVNSGEWEQGRYEFSSLAEAEKYYETNILRPDDDLSEKPENPYLYHTADGYEIMQLEQINGKDIALCHRVGNQTYDGTEDYVVVFGYDRENGEYSIMGDPYSDYAGALSEYNVYFSDLARKDVSYRPDNKTSESEVNSYGYWWNGMLPIRSPERAEQLFNQGFMVYTLNYDNTESAIEKADEIKEYYDSFSPFFGIEKSQWLAYLNSEQAPKELFAELQVKKAAQAIIKDLPNDKYLHELAPEYEADVAALEAYFGTIAQPVSEEWQSYLNNTIEYVSREMSDGNLTWQNELKEQLRLFGEHLKLFSKDQSAYQVGSSEQARQAHQGNPAGQVGQVEQSTAQEGKWQTVVLPTGLAKIRNDKTVKISMPENSPYAGTDFWVSRKFIKDEKADTFKLVLPSNYTVRLSTPQGELTVSSKEIIGALKQSAINAPIKESSQTIEEGKPITQSSDITLDSPVLDELHLSDIRKEFVKKIVSEMENNSTEWVKSWATALPKNAITSKPYRGVNNLILSMTSAEKGYKDSRWLTFNQIKAHNWKLKKGSKAAHIELVKFMDKSTRKEFDTKSVEGMTEEEKREYWTKNVRMLFHGYSVFNASCVEGIPEEKLDLLSDSERNARCESILENSPAKVYYDGRDEAFYSLSSDTIHLPKRERFFSLNDFYYTAFHEVGHSTGHPSRLNRDMTGMRNSPKYAQEELCAEFGSLFIAQDLGIEISDTQLSLSAAYLKGWAAAIKKDPKYLFKAITEGNKIAAYVTGLQAGTTAANNQLERQNDIELMQRGTAKPVAQSKFLFKGGLRTSSSRSAQKNNVSGKSMIME